MARKKAVRRKRKVEPKPRCEAWFNFAKRFAILVVVIFVAAGMLAMVGWENLSALGLVKEAATALAEAAADAFGDSS